MCIGIYFQHQDKSHIVHFTNANARLPVNIKNQPINLLPWGRKNNETGEAPLGGWLDVNSLREGKWNYFFPKPIKIPALKFLESDFEGKLNWFDLTRGQCIQGALIQDGDIQRLYIVTLLPAKKDTNYPRWPKIIVT